MLIKIKVTGIVILIILLIPLCPILVILLCPIVLVVKVFTTAWLWIIVRKTRCEQCGEVLGYRSIALSNKQEAQRVKARRGKRGVWIRPNHAICPKCTAEYRYDFDSRSLLALERTRRD